jgi:hypothetical protein
VVFGEDLDQDLLKNELIIQIKCYFGALFAKNEPDLHDLSVVFWN